MKITKSQILDLMLPQMTDVVQQWDSNGIIIETQFEFAFQHIMKYHIKDVYELIVKYGGHKVDLSDNDGFPLSAAIPIPGEGWMYYFFDHEVLSMEDAETIVKSYFCP